MAFSAGQRAWMVRVGAATAGVLTAVLLAAHFLHPRADFPNFSPWMDYAKYTDEGWYGSAAVDYFTRGGWYVPGDFNPAVALPLWPLLEWVLFHFTGVSLAAARIFAIAIFTGNVGLTYALVRSQAPRWAAWLGALALASNAFLYCFSRLAILEPLMILLMLLAWLLILRLPPAGPRRRVALSAVGLLLCGMVLTKTTAIFLIPSVFCLLWFAQREGVRAYLAASSWIASAAALPWLGYYLLAVRPHYLEDYRYLFSANAYPQPVTAGGWLMAFWYALHGVLWIDPRFGVLAAVLLALSVVFFRGLWRTPLFAGAMAAGAGYVFFIGFHNNMQPRYYQVIAFPLVTAAMLALAELVREPGRLRVAAGSVGLAAMVCTLCVNAREMIGFAFHPQYTFVDAAQGVTRYIDQHPNGNRLLLSISGSNIALVTGLPAICDDFGTLDLPERIRQYQPGWYAAWNELDPGTLEDLHTQFNLQQVANFAAYDDEDRNNLILYKLMPLPPASGPEQGAGRPSRRPKHPPLGGARGKRPEIRRVAG